MHSLLRESLCQVAKEVYTQTGKIPIERYLAWKNIQSVFAIGLFTLYDFPAYSEILSLVTENTSTYIHIIPGLVSGLLQSDATVFTHVCVDLWLSPEGKASQYEMQMESIFQFFMLIREHVTLTSAISRENDMFRSHMYYDVLSHLLLVAEALFTSILTHTPSSIDPVARINYAHLDAVLGGICLAVQSELETASKSLDDSVWLDHSLLSKFIPNCVAMLSAKFLDISSRVASNGSADTPFHENSVPIEEQSAWALLFLPFLENLFKEVSKYSNSCTDASTSVQKRGERREEEGTHWLEGRVEAIRRHLILALSTGMAVLGQLERMKKNTPPKGILIVSPYVRMVQSLFDVETYLLSWIYKPEKGEEKILYSPSSRKFLNLFLCVHIKTRERGLKGEETFYVDGTSDTRAVAVVTAKVLPSSPLLTGGLQDSVYTTTMVGTKSTEILQMLNTQMKLAFSPGQSDITSTLERETAVPLTFCTLYNHLRYSSDCTHSDDEITMNDETLDMVAWIRSYEILSLLLSFMPNDATIEERGLYLSEITKRVRCVFAIGIIPLSPLDDHPTLDSLVETFLSSFNTKQTTLQRLLSDQKHDVNLMASLKIGADRVPLDMPAADEWTSDTPDRTCLLIHLLMSSVPVHSLLELTLDEMIRAQSHHLLLETMIGVIEEVRRNECQQTELLRDLRASVSLNSMSDQIYGKLCWPLLSTVH